LNDLVDRLINLNRVDEAVQEAEKAGDYNLLGLADLFVQHSYGSLANELVSRRANASPDSRLIEWLKEYARKQGNLDQALALAEKLFWLRPAVEAYEEMRQLAQRLEQWPGLRASTLKRMDQKEEYAILTEIFLKEDEIDQALVTLERLKTSNRYWGNVSLQEKVAQAANDKRPMVSIRLYLELVESLVNRRGRGNYAQAASYLNLVREIYLRLGDPQAWQKAIALFREQYHNLPALLDELKQAGL
jgi:uncharacterized Zn finger protein